MPELPEVETIKRRLAVVLPGRVFRDATVYHPKSFSGQVDQLIGQTITGVSRRAKLLHFELSNREHLVTHLKMTGQLLYDAPRNFTTSSARGASQASRLGGGHPTGDWLLEMPGKHTRIEYRFDDDTRLFFNDQRLFGWMRLLSPDEVAQLHAELGPDINTDQASPKYLAQQLARRSIPIKTAIMTNQIVAGVGNIYASDALNLARISPLRPANSLSPEEIERLLAATKDVINRGIEAGGTTFDGQYVNVDGMSGKYQQQLLAYGRAGEACYNCGQPIIKITIAGRGTYYCKECQR